MRTLRRLLIPLCAAAAPHAAGAQHPGQIVRIDANRDGVISRQEFDRARRDDFRRLDRNGDRRLQQREFVVREKDTRALRQRRAARFRAMDRNGDGVVSLAEYMAFGRTIFARLDRDRNGRITRDELGGAAPPPPDGSADGGPALPPPGLGEGSRRPDAARASFGALDRNGDGYITADELDRARNAAFDRLDADRDGKLTAAEVVIIRGRGSTRRFLELDTDRNGVVTRAEFLAAGRRLLKLADTNGDGRISFAEYRRAAPRGGAGNGVPPRR